VLVEGLAEPGAEGDDPQAGAAGARG